MLLKKVNLLYEQIYKEGRLWKKFKKTAKDLIKSNNFAYDLGASIRNGITNLIKGDVQLKYSIYLLQKYIPKLKIKQYKQAIFNCNQQECMIFKGHYGIIDKNIFMKELLIIIANQVVGEDDDNQDLINTIKLITTKKYSPFYDYQKLQPIKNNLTDKLISKYQIKNKIYQLKFTNENFFDYKKNKNISISHIKLV